VWLFCGLAGVVRGRRARSSVDRLPSETFWTRGYRWYKNNMILLNYLIVIHVDLHTTGGPRTSAVACGGQFLKEKPKGPK
jgi:hypothetical protein